ncbi:MAG: 50S ribosomal protein L33 [Candidatus Melainabacteria bacterium]|jgi:large subunit ribosomal protein L33|nr:50S ribosomal protein L33 [Candidatus Melainabacteria bacterium]
MAKKKGDVVVAILECTESKEQGLAPSRYYTRKNKKKHPEKLEFRKYNSKLKKCTLHREVK